MKKTGENRLRINSTYEITWEELGKKFNIPGGIYHIQHGSSNISDKENKLIITAKEYE